MLFLFIHCVVKGMFIKRQHLFYSVIFYTPPIYTYIVHTVFSSFRVHSLWKVKKNLNKIFFSRWKFRYYRMCEGSDGRTKWEHESSIKFNFCPLKGKLSSLLYTSYLWNYGVLVTLINIYYLRKKMDNYGIIIICCFIVVKTFSRSPAECNLCIYYYYYELWK